MKTTYAVIFFLVAFLSTSGLFAQVAVNTDGSQPNTHAMLDVKSSDKGILIPRMTTTERNTLGTNLTTSEKGMMVFDTDENSFYFYDGSSWQTVGVGSSGWDVNNNTISTDSLHQVVIGNNATSGTFEVVTDEASGTYTGDLCTGGTASAQESAPGYPADQAFDDVPSSSWSNQGTLPVWLKYDFLDGNAKAINKYRIYWQGANFDATPTAWQFQASNDDATWTTLDTQSGQSWTSGEWKEFTFSNTTHYRYYRLLISDNQGTANDYVYISEMEMQEMIYNNHPSLFVNDNKVGIGTESPDASAVLEVQSSTKGMLVPRMTQAQRTAIASPATGLMVYQTDATNGFYFYNGTTWTQFTDATNSVQKLDDLADAKTGSTSTYGYSIYLGLDAGASVNTADKNCVGVGFEALKVSYGHNNTAIGYKALHNNTSGAGNIANGANALSDNTIGKYNTANGYDALDFNISGNKNTATGYQTLYYNTTGEFNTANGVNALSSNTTGNKNTAYGYKALYTNKADSLSVAYGYGAMQYADNTTSGRATYNTAIGYEALRGSETPANNTGQYNTSVGYQSLFSNTSGEENTANGFYALGRNTKGSWNTAIGMYSLGLNTEGDDNIANGTQALYDNLTGSDNIAIGSLSLFTNTTGKNNTAIGSWAGYDSNGDGNIFLGYYSGIGETGSNKLYIENSPADANNALIYGEFGSDQYTTGNILRTNSTFQIGNPTGNGYAFPTADGTADQVLKTDGSGNLTWSTGGATKIDDLSDAKSDSDGTNDGSSIFLGMYAGENDDGSDNKNVGVGFEALKANTTGYSNTANGYQALTSNTTGYANTANGYQALFSNISGNYNTANGDSALFSNTIGYKNTAIGFQALYSNTWGLYNTANGFQALYSNTRGDYNTAIGFDALYSNTLGEYNTAIGQGVLSSNTWGLYNTAIGYHSLFSNETGNNNTAIGYDAGYYSTGDGNLFLGNYSGYNETGSNKLYIENSNADADHALIYGEFGTDNTTTDNMLRINGELQVDSGNVQVSERLTAPISGTDADLKPYIYGSLKDSDGSFYTAESTSGFTSTLESTGVYKITFDSYSSDKNYLVIANALRTSAPVILTYEKNIGYFRIRAWDLSGNLVNTYLNFVVYRK